MRNRNHTCIPSRTVRNYAHKVRDGLISYTERGHSPFIPSLYQRMFPTGGNRGCFLTNTAMELADHDAEVRSLVASAQEDVEAFLEPLTRKGKAAGEICLSIKPVETARGLLASLMGILVLVRSRPVPY